MVFELVRKPYFLTSTEKGLIKALDSVEILL